MNEIVTNIEKLFGAVNLPVVLLVISVFYRKHLGQFFTTINQKIQTSSKVSITKDGLTLEEKVQKLQEAQENSEKNLLGVIANKQPNTEAIPPTNELVDAAEKLEIKGILPIVNKAETPTTDPNDPIKGKYGGVPEKMNRKVSANVIELPGNFYKIYIVVESTSANDLLTGTVTFHLHPTFFQPVRTVTVFNGKAELDLISYGSFTLGVVTDKCQLELDLAELPGVSEHFKNT